MEGLSDYFDSSAHSVTKRLYILVERAVIAVLDSGDPGEGFKLWSADWISGERMKHGAKLTFESEHCIYKECKTLYGCDDPRTARAKAREMAARAALVLHEIEETGFEGAKFARLAAWLPDLTIGVEILCEKARMHDELPGIPVSLDAAYDSLREKGEL